MLVLTRRVRRVDHGFKDMVFLLADIEAFEEYLESSRTSRRNFEEVLIQVGELRGGQGKILIDAPSWMGILRGEKIQTLRWQPEAFAKSLKESGEVLLLKLWRGDVRRALDQAKSRRNRDKLPFVVLGAVWFVSIREGESTVAVASPLPRLDVSHSLWPAASPVQES